MKVLWGFEVFRSRLRNWDLFGERGFGYIGYWEIIGLYFFFLFFIGGLFYKYSGLGERDMWGL